MKRREIHGLRFGLLAVALAILSFTAGGAEGQTVLPALTTRYLPAVHIVLDTSGSMYGCDGGSITESVNLTPKPGGGYLYDPKADDATVLDRGNCTASSRSGSTYTLNRLEAAKLALSKILDADSNGVIDAADEQVLRLKLGFTRFDTAAPIYSTHVNDTRAIGTSYLAIWNVVKGLRATGGTPTAPALAGARALSIAQCFDGDPGTVCNLGPDQNDTNGDDKAACRDYFVIMLTDGEPNGVTSQINNADPTRIAKVLREQTLAFTGETNTNNKITDPIVRTISIGFGSAMTGIGTNARSMINCMSYHGARYIASQDPISRITTGHAAADANLDNDNNAHTMDDDTNGATPPVPASITTECNTSGGFNANTRAYGNGYMAANSSDLTAAFVSILNAISAGTFTRSEPTLRNASTVGQSNVYSSFFTIASNSPLWRGSARKFLYTSAGYRDCNNPTVTSNPVVPCWDTGDLLRDRTWSSRVMFFPRPIDYGTKFTYDENISNAGEHRTYWTGNMSASSVPADYQTVDNFVSAISGINFASLTDANVSATVSGLTDAVAVQAWARMGTLQDATKTKRPTLDTMTNTQLRTALEDWRFTAGSPLARFTTGQQRCTTCTAETNASFKQGDSYNSKPIVVGPPTSLITEYDYLSEFRTRPLITGAPAAYAGGDAPKHRSDPTDPFDGYDQTTRPCTTADAPTDAECTVSKRRTMMYLASNDGTLHAFDNITGEELWTFTPPSHMWRLGLQRSTRTSYIDGIPILRDVKFACARSGSNCNNNTTEPFADGKWHTLLMVPQGAGGNFFFTIDITNPVRPIFLWDYKFPDKMGLTYATGTIAEIPSSSLTTLTEPGSVGFLPSGSMATGGPYLHSVKLWNGKNLEAESFEDLPDGETSPFALRNAAIGAPRAIDSNLDGDADRVYFGDYEGRAWKACDLRSDGTFSIAHFFDPAMYDQVVAGPAVGQPISPGSPTSGLGDAEARKRLRGPVFFPADVTKTVTNNLIVVFGSGNILDPLTQPDAYYNLVWGVGDTIAGSGAATCAPAFQSQCSPGYNTISVDYYPPVSPTPPTPTPTPTATICPCQADVIGYIPTPPNPAASPIFADLEPDSSGIFDECVGGVKPNVTSGLPYTPDYCRGLSCPFAGASPTPPATVACGSEGMNFVCDFKADPSGAEGSESFYSRCGLTGSEQDLTNSTWETYCEQLFRWDLNSTACAGALPAGPTGTCGSEGGTPTCDTNLSDGSFCGGCGSEGAQACTAAQRTACYNRAIYNGYQPWITGTPTPPATPAVASCGSEGGQYVCNSLGGCDCAGSESCTGTQFTYCSQYGPYSTWNSLSRTDCPCAFTEPTGTVPPPTGTPIPTPTPLTTTYSNVVALDTLLSAPPTIFKSLMFFAEFNPNTTGDLCNPTPRSRIYNLDVFTCADPGSNAAFTTTVAGVPKPYKEFANELVTGVEISPQGFGIVQTSTPGQDPPDSFTAAGLQLNGMVLGWRQVE